MTFRLLNAFTAEITDYPLTRCPPYLAVSHAWSENWFPQNSDFLSSRGRHAVLAGIAQRFPSIRHCWIDTLCILQTDDADKLRQIPLMGGIFGNAEAVLIILNTELAMSQDEVDRMTSMLEGAVKMSEEEDWTSSGHYWQLGQGRQLIKIAMTGLARLTTTSWSTRVWTLQEYILARRVLWMGTDMVSLSIQDSLFPALPAVCDAFAIAECIGGQFDKLYGYFSGMANCRLGATDRTRVMELLGNRQATVESDEVYGVMAAAGVEISTQNGELKEAAWARWVLEAIGQGHLRWLMMPMAAVPASSLQLGAQNCIVPPFSVRHKASAGSALDHVEPLGPLTISDGTAHVTGRYIGTCQIRFLLGKVHEPEQNRIHRDLTLILFTMGQWQRAVKIASAFGAGRYSHRQTLLIAQVLIENWPRAVRATRQKKEDEFRPKLRGSSHEFVWQDYIAFQMGQMPGMNEGVAYLASIRRESIAIDAVVVTDSYQDLSQTNLSVIDTGARTVDHRCIFLIVQPSDGVDGTMHKVAVTLPVTDEFEILISALPLRTFAIGGSSCQVCKKRVGGNVPNPGTHIAVFRRSAVTRSTLDQRPNSGSFSKNRSRNSRRLVKRRYLRATRNQRSFP
ncbi:heterokaryon incompatibility protein-domain-containing protein [Xylariales sp. PMI_506]|nr:heterokaryon incompatibility protein-domain-containing protein [Xylariales sp. PMI_506]